MYFQLCIPTILDGTLLFEHGHAILNKASFTRKWFSVLFCFVFLQEAWPYLPHLGYHTKLNTSKVFWPNISSQLIKGRVDPAFKNTNSAVNTINSDVCTNISYSAQFWLILTGYIWPISSRLDSDHLCRDGELGSPMGKLLQLNQQCCNIHCQNKTQWSESMVQISLFNEHSDPNVLLSTRLCYCNKLKHLLTDC